MEPFENYSSLPVSREITWHRGRVTSAERARVLKQEPVTIWLTGLSGSGKTSLAFRLEHELIQRNYLCSVLDGDNIRHGLNRDLGFTPDDRTENIRRAAEVARLFNQAGLIVITAFISPYAKDRDAARRIIGEDQFLETYLTADLATCEARDPRGLYAKARSGQIAEFTGVSAPYEVPERPALSLATASRTIDECVQEMLEMLSPRLR
jgi:adenylyl-sulfate kinase